MKWFHNMRIKAKMFTSFFVIIALMMALSVFTMFQMNSIDKEYSHAADYITQRQVTMMDLEINVGDLRRQVVMMAVYTPLNDVARIEQLIEETATSYGLCIEALDKHDALVKNDPQLTIMEMNQLLVKTDEIRRTLSDYERNISSVMAGYAMAGDYDNAIGTILAAIELMADMRNNITAMVEHSTTAAIEANEVTSAMLRNETILIIVITATATVLALFIALYVASMLSKPLKPLSTFMKKAGSTGSIEIMPEDADCIADFGQYKDEIGEAISGAALFIQHVKSIAEKLEIIANNDLTTEIHLLSDEDTMGLSLAKVVDSLNNMFGNINSSTDEVSSGSKQIAEGALLLASGSTQQAAAVEELSSSISEIADMTKENAVKAGKAAALADKIMKSAEMGSTQMNEMMAAVVDINQASNSISKVIKVIDDIAFQTNILALNAAVEAARAGHHGKGFAVVAEEVRNLAAKSAEAAKDTGVLIQNSMEKAELGTRIANDTAASLDEIVAGISESSELANEIAKSSEEQSLGISQIDTGINQVTQVVQQNSATAQENAAVSQEMSGQSDILHQLITQFKLRANRAMFGLVASEDAPINRLGPPDNPGYSVS